MRTRIYSIAAVASLAVAGLTGCTSGTDTASAAETPTFTPVDTVAVAADDVELPAGALDAARGAAEQCDAVTAELVVGKIAASSGYDPDYTADDGSAGIAGMYPEKWKDYGTGDLADRGDLEVSTDAVAAELCDAYAAAEELVDAHPDTDVEDLALSITLVGQRYTAEYGVPDDAAATDYHDVRAQITEITDAADSVTT